MKFIKCQVTCNDCGRYSEGRDTNEEDARLMANNNHGHEFKCALTGEPRFTKGDTNADRNAERKSGERLRTDSNSKRR